MPKQEWYAVRSIFRTDQVEDDEPVRSFEERVVVLRASSESEALAKGNSEALRYAEQYPNPVMLDHLVVFSLWEADLREGEEVWSCLRQTDLSDEDFLVRYYSEEMLGGRHIELGEDTDGE